MARAGSRSGIRPVYNGIPSQAWSRATTREYDDLRTWSVGRLRSEQTARLPGNGPGGVCVGARTTGRRSTPWG